VAIRAANLAPGYLSLDATPRIAAASEEANHVTRLRPIRVIELEDKRIGLAAVDAGMLQQEVPQTARPAFATIAHESRIPRDVNLAIQAVVFLTVRNEAIDANGLALPRGLVSKIEVFFEPGCTAPRAGTRSHHNRGRVGFVCWRAGPQQQAALWDVRSCRRPWPAV
jgi:hypothetical protein